MKGSEGARLEDDTKTVILTKDGCTVGFFFFFFFFFFPRTV